MGLLVIAYLLMVRKCRRPLRDSFYAALGGVATLAAVNLFSGVTLVGIPVNLVTVGCSALLGACGTVLMLLIRLLSVILR